MRHVVFDDGRSLLVSPDHPTCASAETTQGATRSPATLFDLDVGLRYDRGVVKRAELASYDESETFDVLPSGDTGCYWANGVLLGSTLR